MKRHESLIPLSHQHHDALSLCVLVERSLRADRSPANIEKQAQKAVTFAESEGENHFQLEEEILFPLIEQSLGGHPLIAQLREEHRQLRELAAHLAQSPDILTLESFTKLLASHVRREEKELFEDVQHRLPEPFFAQAGEAMRARAIQICVTK
jgi:hemerythrin-like domain-containing protein